MWELSGGRDRFEKLVPEFYVGVATDEVLLPMYPEQPELEGAIQRHMPFKVNPDARDRWLQHAQAALDTLKLPPLYDAEIRA